MSLKILCAGCSLEERQAVEAEVAAVLGARRGPWTVSLVKIGDRWSVTLEGPDRSKGATFMAAGGRIRQSITEALERGAPPADAPAPQRRPGPSRPAAPAAAGPRGERRDRHECSKCRKPYVIVYETEANEPTETVPVACPGCWQIDHVAVAQSAGINSDYRVETVD